MRVCEPLAASYELNFPRKPPPCGVTVGFVPDAGSVHAPAVPETCAVAQPVLLSNPFVNSVEPLPVVTVPVTVTVPAAQPYTPSPHVPAGGFVAEQLSLPDAVYGRQTYVDDVGFAPT